MRGNVLDLAVAVVIGGAFGLVVTSFVNDLLMPPIGRLLGRVNFTDFFVSLDGRAYPTLAAAKAAGAPTLNYGAFVTTVVNFVVIAFAIFALTTQVKRFGTEPPKAAAPTRECPFCAMTIPLKARKCPHCTTALADTV
jgi:large conductance mechanosensitive channel